jgi:hypothetical protein
MRPSELSGNFASIVTLLQSRRNLAKEMMNLAFELHFSYSAGYFNMSGNSTTWSRQFFFFDEGLLWIFIALKNPSLLPGLKPQTLAPLANTVTITPPRFRS